MMNKTLEDLALTIGMGSTLTAYRVCIQQYGYEYRKNKDASDLVKAKRKAFSTPPFKTEMHISLLEAHLKTILKKVKA